jgi:hypothetical protein
MVVKAIREELKGMGEGLADLVNERVGDRTIELYDIHQAFNKAFGLEGKWSEKLN